MACLVIPLSILLVLTIMTTTHPIQAQVTIDPTSPTSTAIPTTTTTGDAVCGTSASDWRMSPPTAMLLASIFCNDLYQPGNFPARGKIFNSTHYPTELSPSAGSPNYTAMELSGLIVSMWLSRANTTVIDGVEYIHGTDEQCARDNCTAGFESAIDLCQYNSHYVGGINFFLSDCGIYQIHIANCSGNWLDPDCDRWHILHPGVGLSKNESLVGAAPPKPLTATRRTSTDSVNLSDTDTYTETETNALH
ncbi:uncharacterized protein Z518_02668 [Rhinocladiella mackenziei CBS 650.93]|uniref:Uncharacterized protein n=1 Tax=Rhinocladiella mackenziei CBS 650.93 TaxID=1442369 RepID=A0A0D2HC67_9EURO|nr:uncharacterized protein Z518_02668 [Rhinocladiella mackenziei CBS 650.93]KIX08013.1 hypothetical protein Z518_02668 [Rhinocladiella mackenziei CBS 650.93]